jgi:N-methylhydantoinase B
MLSPAQLTLLSERRKRAPWGLAGGGDGRPSRATLTRAREERALGSKQSISVQPGDRVRVETPGGGGWGSLERPRPGRRAARARPRRRSRRV